MEDIDRPQAQPISNTKSQIETFATRVAFNLGFQPGDDLRPLLEKLKGSIEYTDDDAMLEEGVSGSLDVKTDGSFIIKLPLVTSPNRDRFTIAHELGHFFLHSHAGKYPIYVFRQGSDRLEWQANWFAGSFLMPEQAVRDIIARFPDKPSLWATYFKVSQIAMDVRCKSLER